MCTIHGKIQYSATPIHGFLISPPVCFKSQPHIPESDVLFTKQILISWNWVSYQNTQTYYWKKGLVHVTARKQILNCIPQGFGTAWAGMQRETDSYSTRLDFRGNTRVWSSENVFWSYSVWFESWICLLVTVYPSEGWNNFLISPYLQSQLCKTRIVIWPISFGYCEEWMRHFSPSGLFS